MVTGAPVSGSSSPPSHLAGLARRVAYSLDAVTVRVSNKDGEIGRVVLTEQPRNLQHLGPQPLGGTLELAYLLTRLSSERNMKSREPVAGLGAETAWIGLIP